MDELMTIIKDWWPYINSNLFILITGSLIYFFGKTITKFTKDELTKDEIYLAGFFALIEPLLIIVIAFILIENINWRPSLLCVIILITIQSELLKFIDKLKTLVVLGKYYGLGEILKYEYKKSVKKNKRLSLLFDYFSKFDLNVEKSIKSSLYIANNKLFYMLYLILSTIIFVITVKYGNLVISLISGLLYFISLGIYDISISIINSTYPKSIVKYGRKKLIGFIVKETDKYIKLRLVDKPKFVYLYHNKIDYIESNIFKDDAQKKYSKYYKKGASK